MRQGQINQDQTTKNPIAANIATPGDVVAFLKSQHETIKATFAKVLAATGQERETQFLGLKQLLTIHEAAEEKIVHPAAKRAIEGGAMIVGDREKEEEEAKSTLARLATLDVSSPEFETKFRAFQAAVLKHAKAEETLEFDKLETTVDSVRLNQMKSAVIDAEKQAASIKN